MTKDTILDKLNSQSGYLVEYFIVGLSVGALMDNGSGKYSAYYWYNFNRYDEKLGFTGTDSEATEVFNAFKTLYNTMYKVAKEGSAKRVQVKLPGKMGSITPGIIVTILSGLVGLFFVGSLIDYIIIKTGKNKDHTGTGDMMRNIYQAKSKDPTSKNGPEYELLGRIVILALIAAIGGTAFRIDKNYKSALDTLAKYKVIRYSTVTGLITKTRYVTDKELKEAKKKYEDNEIVNFGATDADLEKKYPGFSKLSKKNKQEVRNMDNSGKSKADIMKYIKDHKNDGGENKESSKKPDVNYFADQVAVNIKGVFKDKWTKIFVLAGVVLVSFIIMDMIRGNRTEEEARKESIGYLRLEWLKSIFDRMFGKLA